MTQGNAPQSGHTLHPAALWIRNDPRAAHLTLPWAIKRKTITDIFDKVSVVWLLLAGAFS
jgi:hypothetical protein